MKVKEESEKVGLKLNIQKTKIMASGPITSWQIDGETLETVSEFILGAPKSLQMVIAAMTLKDTYSFWYMPKLIQYCKVKKKNSKICTMDNSNCTLICFNESLHI